MLQLGSIVVQWISLSPHSMKVPGLAWQKITLSLHSRRHEGFVSTFLKHKIPNKTPYSLMDFMDMNKQIPQDRKSRLSAFGT